MQPANFGASHYATVAPSRFTKLEGTIVANVGSWCGFLDISTDFHNHDNEVKYYYNEKQEFSCDKDAKTAYWPSLNTIKGNKNENVWSISDDIKKDIWKQWI